MLVFTAGFESDRLLPSILLSPKGEAKWRDRRKETYGFQLRFGDGAGVLLAVTLGSCFCAVAHDC